MTERVRALGGSLRLESGPEGGTLVLVEVDHQPHATAA
jgi:signal transduction histidine kinase